MNEQLTPSDLKELERILLDSGTGSAGDIATAGHAQQGLGLFVRSLVGLDREEKVFLLFRLGWVPRMIDYLIRRSLDAVKPSPACRHRQSNCWRAMSSLFMVRSIW